MRLDEANLLGWCEACDAATQMAEVLRTNRETQDLFDDRREVRQRTNDSKRWSIGGARQAASRGQSQRVLDRFKRNTALVQLGREQTVWTAHGAARARSRTVSFQKLADIVALLHGSALEFA